MIRFIGVCVMVIFVPVITTFNCFQLVFTVMSFCISRLLEEDQIGNLWFISSFSFSLGKWFA